MGAASSDRLPRSEEEMREHVGEYERWFAEQMKAAGHGSTQLVAVEHAILRSYITWLRDHRDAAHHSHREV